MSVEELRSLGLNMGNAKLVKDAIDALAPPTSPAVHKGGSDAGSPASAAAAKGGGSVAAAAVGISSLSLSPSFHSSAVASAHAQPKACTVSFHHLPSVSLSSLPPLTHVCGSPGASGSVFKIEYQGKPAALKKFHDHMHDMLRRELKSLQLLVHPNIVRVLAVATDAASQPVGFVMEYLPLPLDHAMQHMTLRQATYVLGEVCIGIAVVHDLNIIHNDIKPGNVLISLDLLDVKLADFGLAHAVTASLSSVSMARGTPLYAAAASCCGTGVNRLPADSWRLSCTTEL